MLTYSRKEKIFLTTTEVTKQKKKKIDRAERTSVIISRGNDWDLTSFSKMAAIHSSRSEGRRPERSEVNKFVGPKAALGS